MRAETHRQNHVIPARQDIEHSRQNYLTVVIVAFFAFASGEEAPVSRHQESEMLCAREHTVM